MAPHADIIYACDPGWWAVNLKNVDAIFAGKKYTQKHRPEDQAVADERGLTAIPGVSVPGLGLDRIHFNSNSGAQAINLAYLHGATDIILLGFDMGWTGGKSHFFGDHPRGLTNGRHEVNVPNFNKLAADLKRVGVRVYNATRETKLTQFDRFDLSEALELCAQ